LFAHGDTIENCYFRARYYDQNLGGFFSRDPPFFLQSLYIFCDNSPENLTDPFAMQSLGNAPSGSKAVPWGMVAPWLIWWPPSLPPSAPCVKKGDTRTVLGKSYTSTGKKDVDGGRGARPLDLVWPDPPILWVFFLVRRLILPFEGEDIRRASDGHFAQTKSDPWPSWGR